MEDKSQRRNKHAAIACTSCKQRRSKCNEETPCANCVKLSLECVYEVGRDGRRREFHQQALKDRQTKIDEYEQLLEIIRTADAGIVRKAVQAIRKGASVLEAVAAATTTPKNGEKRDWSKMDGSNHDASPDDHTRLFQEVVSLRAEGDEDATIHHFESYWAPHPSADVMLGGLQNFEHSSSHLHPSLSPLELNRNVTDGHQQSSQNYTAKDVTLGSGARGVSLMDTYPQSSSFQSSVTPAVPLMNGLQQLDRHDFDVLENEYMQCLGRE